MGWGIVYPPYSILNMGGNPPPQTRWVYKFNGVNTYIDTGGYTYSGDFWVEVKAQIPTQLPAGNQAFFGGSGGGSPNPGAFTAFLNPSQGFISVQIPTTSGIRYDLSTPVATYMGSTITLRLERLAGIWSMLINGAIVDTFDSNSFGVVDMQVTSIARWSTIIYYNGAVYDYKDSLGNNLPINDRTFGDGAPIANSATVLGSNLWGGQNLTVANIGVVTTVVSGEEWDVYSLNGSPLNVLHGARVNVFSGLIDGEQYLYDVDSSEPVNIAVYNTNYQLISGGTVENGKGILFTHNGTSRVYVCPRTTNTVRVSNGRVRLANGYATGVNLLESGWEEIPL